MAYRRNAMYGNYNPYMGAARNLTRALIGDAGADASVANAKLADAKREQLTLQTQRENDYLQEVNPLLESLGMAPRGNWSVMAPNEYGPPPMETPDQITTRNQNAIADIQKLRLRTGQGKAPDILRSLMMLNSPATDDRRLAAAAFGANTPDALTSLGDQTQQDIDVARGKEFAAAEAAQQFPAPFTLSQGQARFDGNGQPVVSVAPKPDNRTPRNYVVDGRNYITYDGLTDAQGAPLPSGGHMASVTSPTAEGAGMTNATQTAVEKGQIQASGLLDLVQRARKIAENPQNFGASGLLRSTVQDAIQQGSALGRTLADMGVQTQQEILQAGPDAPSAANFDATLPQLDVVQNLLAYQLAKFNDPGGRVSDADFKAAQAQIRGSSFLGNQQNFLARLDLLEQMAQGRRETNPLSGAPAQGAQGGGNITHKYVPGQGLVPVGGQ